MMTFASVMQMSILLDELGGSFSQNFLKMYKVYISVVYKSATEFTNAAIWIWAFHYSWLNVFLA